MEAVITAPRMTLEMNTRLMLSSLDGLAGDDALRRIGEANHAVFLAAHLTDARHFLLTKMIGGEAPKPFGGTLDATNDIDEVKEFPSLDEIRETWTDLAPRLDARLRALTAEEIAVPSAPKFPIADETVLGGICFLMAHESYHIGQIGLLRRQFGQKAMSFR